MLHGVRAINEMVCSTFPTSGQSTLKKWYSVKSATQLSSSEKQPTEFPKHTSCTGYISSQRKGYVLLTYLFRDKLETCG